jgi:hypothetical protein
MTHTRIPNVLITHSRRIVPKAAGLFTEVEQSRHYVVPPNAATHQVSTQLTNKDSPFCHERGLLAVRMRNLASD